MKINLLTPALALAALVFLFLFLWTCEGNRNSKMSRQTELNVIQRLQADTSRLKGELRLLQATRQEITERAAQNRVRDSVALEGLKTRNRDMSRQLADARKDIQPIIDTSAIVRRYVDLADSTIARRDSTINFMGMTLKAQQFDHKEEVRAMAKENVKLIELNSTYEKFIKRQESDLKKAEKKARRNRTLAVIGTVLGFAGGVILSN